MPAIGDQHKPSGSVTANPFDSDKPTPSAYTAAEIATLQSRLDKQLGPEYISSRPGAAGQKVHYLAAEKVINLANEVFGFNGWSSSIQNIQIDFVDENTQTGKISLGLSVIVRVTLKDGTFHEDIGYGHIENCKGKAAAFEKCKKEGTTDGMKRALRTFGNVLGNCIYDKEFVAKVTKVKVGAGRWDVNELHRHPDYVKKEVEEDLKTEEKMSTSTTDTLSSNEALVDGFDMADFDEADFNMSDPLGHPDEIVLPTDSGAGRQGMGPSGYNAQMRPPVRSGATTPSRAPQPRNTPAQPVTAKPYPGPAPSSNTYVRPPMQQLQQPFQDSHPHNQVDRHQPQPNTTAPREQPTSNNNRTDGRSSSPGLPSQHFAPPQNTNQSPDVNSMYSEAPGFLSAKAADNPNAAAAARFNPHAESPSIRKTPGIDHRKSAPIKHDLVKQPLPSGIAPPGQGSGHAAMGSSKDFVDPRSNTGRQLGVGGIGQSPQPSRMGAPAVAGAGGMMTSAYRPLTRHGGLQTPNGPAPPTTGNLAAGVKRPPLHDVSNSHPGNHQQQQQQHVATAVTGDGIDAKRAKVVPGAGVNSGTENINVNGNGNRNAANN